MSTPSVNVHRLSQVEQARTAIMHEGDTHSPLVADWISQSWQRCLSQGMQPHDEVGFDPLSGAHVKRTLDQNHELIQAARPGVDRHDRRVDVIARIGIDLSERAVGTSAICAALIEQKPVWLHRGEHFFKDTSIYSCAGAPLWNGQGDCIGMLDLTAVMTQERPELMHLAALSARSISNAYLLSQPHHLLLRLNWPGRLMGDDNDGLMLLNSDGEVLGANPLAREMLHMANDGHPHASDLFAIPTGLLFDGANQSQPMEVPLWSGLNLQVRSCLQHDCNNSSQPATTGALQQIQLAMINKAVAHAKGNVAQAAKALGISRATLYRKLSRKSSH
ncbi:MAG: histidine kinase [Betaproteobacteria bacterium]|nr:histidine kinase [Betaproteobacteria bacterium]